MNETTTTIYEAIKDFETNIWRHTYKDLKKENHKDYLCAYRIIWDNNHNKEVSVTRAQKMLKKHGRGRYAVETTFKILTNEA